MSWKLLLSAVRLQSEFSIVSLRTCVSQTWHLFNKVDVKREDAELRCTAYLQHEYEANKPARDAAAKAKAEANAEEASRAAEVPLHTENEWNIRSVVNDPLYSMYLSEIRQSIEKIL